MDKKIIIFVAIMLFSLGCATQQNQPASYPSPGGASNMRSPEALVFDPIDPSALPEVRDLPVSITFDKPKTARRYTGIIKNITSYDLAVPSKNSSATFSLPAKGWIEYTAWEQKFDLTVYRDGKPFYCLRINAHPREYPYMCKKYDFIAEVVAAEPVKESKPVRKKRSIKKKPIPKGEGVEGLG